MSGKIFHMCIFSLKLFIFIGMILRLYVTETRVRLSLLLVFLITITSLLILISCSPSRKSYIRTDAFNCHTTTVSQKSCTKFDKFPLEINQTVASIIALSHLCVTMTTPSTDKVFAVLLVIFFF
jgi:hypothetical protein